MSRARIKRLGRLSLAWWPRSHGRYGGQIVCDTWRTRGGFGFSVYRLDVAWFY